MNIREMISYDPDTGRFTNLVNRDKAKIGDEPGAVNVHGYRQICLRRKMRYAHHLAVFFMTGDFPPKGSCVDHINGIKDDNRWVNLRVTNYVTNGHNRTKINKNNTSGIPGVSFYKNGWVPTIKINRKQIYLGRFKTVEEAVAARDAYRAANCLG